jgi:hypothetical protein
MGWEDVKLLEKIFSYSAKKIRMEKPDDEHLQEFGKQLPTLIF